MVAWLSVLRWDAPRRPLRVTTKSLLRFRLV